MALVECHTVINRQTLQFRKVRDCKVKFPETDFPLHHYLPAITTIRGGRDRSLSQENRGERSLSLEVKASCAKLVFQTEIPNGDQDAFSGHYVLPSREDMWRISAHTIPP